MRFNMQYTYILHNYCKQIAQTVYIGSFTYKLRWRYVCTRYKEDMNKRDCVLTFCKLLHRSQHYVSSTQL